jgi:serine/threonine-protein kinase
MTLTTGTRIGPYEIVSALGAGGMGEVFRARDTRLKREVALKVLPPTVAKDQDRIARFEREAEMLAALNHPNIAQIHGVVDADDALVLVMELVDGEDLAVRIARGPVPVDEALPIARQIADALEAVHERGIIHRDLKPANIKVRPDGTVKVLDFGLARSDAPGPDSAMSAVTSPAMTMQGVIIGTAAYMSPEQARGKPVDRRADVWAYGAVLFEMLTGKRPFDGSDATDTIAAVLRADPDWQLLPRDVPEAVRMLIRRCLDKDPQRRPSHLSVATFVLSGGGEAGASASRASALSAADTVPTARGRRRLVALAVSTFLAGVAVAGGIAWRFVAGRPEPAATPPIRFTIAVDTSGEAWRDLTDRPFVMSPDGRAIVYRSSPGGLSRLFIRTLDRLEARPLVEGAGLVRTPFFSPDSQWVGFFDGPALKKVPVSGGPAVTIGTVNGGGFGASWSDDGGIVFGGRREGIGPATTLMTIPASGGEAKNVEAVDRGSDNADTFPVVLPQSRGVLFRMHDTRRGASSEGRLMLLDRATGERRELAAAVSGADFVDGRIVYADPQGHLFALPFDVSTLKVSGPAIALAERIHAPPVGQAMFSAAFSGALAFLPALQGTNPESARSLVWVDRQGREEPIAAPPRAYAVTRLSPDGTRVALDIRDEGNDIWIWSLDRGVLTRLTRAPTLDMAPVWTPDGRRIIWTSTRDDFSPTLYWQAADGTGSAERLGGPPIAYPGSVTPDGQAVLWSSGGFAIMRTSLTGERRTDRALGPLSSVLTPEVSPDGRWLAYQSNESGQPEVCVRPYPNVDAGRWQISTERGSRPAWSRNGRELFFLDGTDRLSVAPIAANGSTFGSRRSATAARYGVLPGIHVSRRLPPRLRRVSRRAAVPHDQGPGGRGRVANGGDGRCQLAAAVTRAVGTMNTTLPL